MKKLIYGAVFLAIVGSIIYGCEKEENAIQVQSISNEKSKLNINKSNNEMDIISISEVSLEATYNTPTYTLELFAEDVEYIHSSTLKIKIDDEIIYENTFELGTEGYNYRNQTRNLLVLNANTFEEASSLSLNEISILANIVFDFAKGLTVEIGEDFLEYEAYQSIFYHTSILKMAKRKIEQDLESCDCWTYTNYLMAEGSFTCTEDLSFSGSSIASHYTSKYSEIDSLILDSLGIDSLIAYAQANEDSQISLKMAEDIMFAANIDSTITTDTISNSRIFGKCKGMDRADIGCCGSRPRCGVARCRLCFDACETHDLACMACDKWWCGPNCNT